MVLIGVSGKRGTGKTTFGNIFCTKYGFKHYAFAQVLKDKVAQDFGLYGNQVDGKEKEIPTQMGWTPRQLMVDYGQFYRKYDPMYWVKQLKHKLTNYCVISDVRFKNEAEWIKSQGGYLVRLNRHPSLNIYQGTMMDISETDLDNYDRFDFNLMEEANITIKDLEDFAYVVYNSIKIKERDI
jgi:hypothetical protein